MTTTVTLTGTLADIARSGLATETLVDYPVPWTAMRVFDAYNTNLPGTAGTDDLALVGGTHGTNVPMIQSSNSSGTTVTQKLRFVTEVPAEYQAAQPFKIRINGRVQVQANVSATVDVSVYESDKDGTTGADLCTTAAQSINSTSFANRDFDITATTLAAGDQLDVLVTVAIDDTAGANASIAELGYISRRMDIKG